jgi:hypothetical protein
MYCTHLFKSSGVDTFPRGSSAVCGLSLSGRTESMLRPPCRELFPRALSDSLLERCNRDPRAYLKQVMKATNMSCLTPEGAMSGDCDFLSANMYARSLFGGLYTSFSMSREYADANVTQGEDALANLSIEKTEAGTISGHVRIRSKTQGIALSLGDRITMGERNTCE